RLAADLADRRARRVAADPPADRGPDPAAGVLDAGRAAADSDPARAGDPATAAAGARQVDGAAARTAWPSRLGGYRRPHREIRPGSQGQCPRTHRQARAGPGAESGAAAPA